MILINIIKEILSGGDGISTLEKEDLKKYDIEQKQKYNDNYKKIKSLYIISQIEMEDKLKEDPIMMETLLKIQSKINNELDKELKNMIKLELFYDPESGGEPSLNVLFPLNGYTYDNKRNELIYNKILETWHKEGIYIRNGLFIMPYVVGIKDSIT